MPQDDAPVETQTVTLRIEGNVQGVGFRNWTQRLAGQLGIEGWVRNRRDGSVEALLHGPPAAVEEAITRCRIGPRSAKVRNVRIEAGSQPPSEKGFEILPGL